MTGHKDAPSELLNQLLQLDKIIVKSDPDELMPRMSTLYVVGMMEVAVQAPEANSAFAFIPEQVKAYAQMCMTRIAEVLGTDFGDATPTTMGDRLAAVDSSTSVSTLRTLARRDDLDLRVSVAANPNLPLDVLQTLAEDEDQFVRAGAARNPALPLALQFQLAQDGEYLVRKALLDNERLSTTVENRLYQDDEPEIREYLTAKRTDSASKLRHLARSEDYETRGAVAVNPNSPTDALRLLARDDEALVRGALLERTDLPAEVLLTLSRDVDSNIEEEATRLLEMRRLVPVELGETPSTGQGYVYILMNASMPGILKIGRTARRSQDRVAELSSHTGVPTPFELVYERPFGDCARAERDLHARLAEHRVSKDREFFKIPVYEAVNALMALEAST